jgi:2OG-Fe(II) oxygenase superfamily
MTNLPLIKYPGFLTQEEYDQCGCILKDETGWNRGGTSLGTPGKNFGNKDLNEYEIFSKTIFEKIRARTGDDLVLKRVYANGQDVGEDGEFHQDDVDPNSWTFLLYMNTIEDGGETEFQVGSSEMIVAQKAVLNLGVFFKADILHRGLAPKTGNERRITVAWKLGVAQKAYFFTEPVPHCIIRNYYTPEEMQLIWEELDFLKGKLLPPEQTGTAVGPDGKPRKKNKGAFVDDLYTRRELSNILRLNRKISSPDVTQRILGQNWFYNYLKPSDRLGDRTLISYYEDGDYYEPHTDSAMVTAISYHWKEPCQFEGGDLFFGNYRVPIENNCLLIFPSCTEHEVKPVRGHGRYALTQFINFK